MKLIFGRLHMSMIGSINHVPGRNTFCTVRTTTHGKINYKMPNLIWCASLITRHLLILEAENTQQTNVIRTQVLWDATCSSSWAIKKMEAGNFWDNDIVVKFRIKITYTMQSVPWQNPSHIFLNRGDPPMSQTKQGKKKKKKNRKEKK